MAAHQDPGPIKIDICKGVEGAGFLYAEIEMDAAPAKFGVRSSRVGAVQHQPAGRREFLIGNCIAEVRSAASAGAAPAHDMRECCGSPAMLISIRLRARSSAG